MPIVNKKFLAALLLLGLTATCVSAADTPPSPTKHAITREQALTIALDKSNGGTVVESEIDRGRSGQTLYEFEIVNDDTRFEIEIDSSDGSITEFKQQQISPTNRPFIHPKMNAAEAETIAIRHAGGGEVVKYELEREKGTLIHEVTVLKNRIRHRMEINDADGQLVSPK